MISLKARRTVSHIHIYRYNLYTFAYSQIDSAAPRVTALAAYFMALRGNAGGRTPMNQYICNLIQGYAYSRVRGGPRVLSNEVPIAAFGQCNVRVNQKRGLDVDGSDDACSLAPRSSSSTTSTSIGSSSRMRTSSTLRKSVLNSISIVPGSDTSPPAASKHESNPSGTSSVTPSTAILSTVPPLSSAHLSTPPATTSTRVTAPATPLGPASTIVKPLPLACVLQ